MRLPIPLPLWLARCLPDWGSDMKLQQTTPDGAFTVTIRCYLRHLDEEVPATSLAQLVQLLDQTAALFRPTRDATATEVKASTKRMLVKHRKSLTKLAKR